MQARDVAPLTDEEICQKAAVLFNKPRVEVAIKKIKQVQYLCVRRNEAQVEPDVHVRFFSYCNIKVEATLLREGGQVTPFFKMPLEGDHGARVLIGLLEKEHMLRFTHESYVHHHPKLLELLARGIPGKFEPTAHGAKVLLTKAEANKQFATIFTEPKLMKSIKFADDHFLLPYFTYAFLDAEKMVKAMTELVIHAPQDLEQRGPIVVLIERDCDSACHHAAKPH